MEWTLLAVTVFVAALFLFLGIRPRLAQDTTWKRMVDPSRFAESTSNHLSRVTEQKDDRDGGGWMGGLETEARKAGLRITAAQFVASMIVVGLAAAGLAYTLIPRWYIGAVAALVGGLVPRYLIAKAKRRRAEAFAQTLDGALGIMASSLRAGTSLAIAIARAAERSEDPIRAELERASKAIELGATAAEALAAVSKRVDSRDWDLVTTATNILTRTGGNLAEVYDQIAATIRARRMARKAILVQTAQIRLTGTVVAMIPVAITFFLRMMNPEYFTPMLKTPIGVMVFAAMFGLIAFGWSWIRRMANVSPD